MAKDMPQLVQSELLVGTYRRFGAIGPVYEILEVAVLSREGHRLAKIRVLETGEELQYPLEHILSDPRDV